MVQIVVTNENIEESKQENIEENEENIKVINCPICFTENTNNYITLKCEHVICTICFQTWHINKSQNVCCICRKEIFSILDDKEEEESNGEITINIIYVLGIISFLSVLIFSVIHIYKAM